MNFRLFVCFLFLFRTIVFLAYDHNIVVIIPSYNNQKFYRKNLDQLFLQDYKNFRVIYIDDCSQDKTAELVEQYIHDNNLYNKIMLVKNNQRCGALRNIYMSIHCYCNDDDIVVIYDGDDWLATQKALTIVNQAYQDKNVWTTYGNFSSTRHGCAEWCRPFENKVVRECSYRRSDWRFGPLRTFYAWLFKRIELKDLLYQGAFYQMSGDQAFVHPILEMANGRFKFISQILYIYNEHNPINDWNINRRLQHHLRNVILVKQPYKPLRQKPIFVNTNLSIYTINIFSDIWDQDRMKKLLADPEFIKCDMVLFIDADQESSISQNIQEHAQLLKQFHATLVTYVRYDNVEHGIEQKIKNCSYLWQTLFTSQLGWKPELLYPYKEFAWLIPIKICKENVSFVCELLQKRSSYQLSKRNRALAHNSGLLVISTFFDKSFAIT